MQLVSELTVEKKKKKKKILIVSENRNIISINKMLLR